MQPKPVSKKAILNLLPASVFFASFWFFGVYAIFIGLGLSQIFPKTAVVVFWCLTVVVTIFILCFPYFYWRWYRYEINKKFISLQKGIFWRSIESAPIKQVHQISVLRSPIDRITGLSKVRVITAGGDIVIRFLSKQQVQEFEEIFKANNT